MTISVSDKVLKRVFQIIERLQKASPYEAVTKNRVRAVIEKPTSTKPKLDYKTIGRAFRKFVDSDRIIKSSRGQYWLPEYLEKNVKYLKKRLEFEESFWRDVKEPMISKKFLEMQKKLFTQEIYYEDKLLELERQFILFELRENDLRAWREWQKRHKHKSI